MDGVVVPEERIAEFRERGATVLPGVLPADVVARLRDLLDPEFDGLFAARRRAEEAAGEPPSRDRIGLAVFPGRLTGTVTEWLPQATARALAPPVLLEPSVLALAEALLECPPQLDAMRVGCFPSLPPAEFRGTVEHMVGWHVDRFSPRLDSAHESWMPPRPPGADGVCPPRCMNCLAGTRISNCN